MNTTKRAKTLAPDELSTLLAHIDANSPMPVRDRLIVLLSFKAGLRVGEITKIDLGAVTDASGRIGKTIHVLPHVAKKKRERKLPMHPEVKVALATFMKAYPGATSIAISSQPFRYADRPNVVEFKPVYKEMSVNALTLYYRRLLIAAGFVGASSHSGRRTFGTELARRANTFHNSLKDVQRLMGHARLDTTERYLEPSEDTFDMVASL